jgi:uncharacterized membrane protein YadS
MSDAIVKDFRPQRADGVVAPINEDWLAVVLGLLFSFSPLAALANVDLIGWVVTTSVWSNLGQALRTTSKDFSSLGGVGALIATYVALLVVLSAAAVALKSNVTRFALAFTAVFWIAYASWVIGNFANFAAVTAAEQQKFGISWSLKLTNEGGYIFALIAGLIIANFFPRFAEAVKDAVRPELYIKVAIVILGGVFAVTAAGKLGLASSLILRGVAAIVEAYLIYWAVVYFVARKWFGFSREWAAPLASGISICGVSAAIAVGGAIRARPVVPVLVSSLVVIFAVVEVLILPFIAQAFLSHEPLVAGAWMGLAVKTDGAAVAAGGITESLILAKNAAEGVNYQPGWILGTAATIKVFIDIFIGIWAFILGYIWTNHINVTPDQEKAKAWEIWQRFPKFIIGFLVTFVVGPLPRARHAGGCREKRARGNRRSQYVPRHLLYPDFLLHRRAFELQDAMAGGLRQARRRLSHQLVRLCRLGRPVDLVDILQRDHAAVGQLRSRQLKESVMTHSDIRNELRNAPVEPLLPIEKKLIGWSLTIGLVLLVGLALLNHFVPATF